MKRVPYSAEELEMIVESNQEEMPLEDIVRLVNSIFHNEKPIRNKRTIKYIVSKLGRKGTLYENV